MSDNDIRHAGFKDRVRVASAREALREVVTPHGRTDCLAVGAVDGRVLAESIVADRNVPHYARAAMDGYAVRAADTFGASDRSPQYLVRSETGDPGAAVRVHTGSVLPDGTDAVVMIEQVEEVGTAGETVGTEAEAVGTEAETVGTEIEVYDAVTEGENVGAVGEDIEAGRPLFEPGHRLRPSDIGLLRSTGVDEVSVASRPQVAVIPTGEELVEEDPGPGEIVETNGLTVSQYVRRWGGDPTYREIVTDDEDALREAIQRDLTSDVVVTTGGSSVGERDLVPAVVADLGEVFVHGVALKPGHPVALGVVEGTPVIMLPGYPVACIVNAVQFLRPTTAWLLGAPVVDHPTVSARLSRKIRSEPGVRTFVRVSLERNGDAVPGEDVHSGDVVQTGGDTEPRDDGEHVDSVEFGDDAEHGSEVWVATPTRASGSGVLSSVALADGWVEVPESRDGIPDGETVSVKFWEWSP